MKFTFTEEKVDIPSVISISNNPASILLGLSDTINRRSTKAIKDENANWKNLIDKYYNQPSRIHNLFPHNSSNITCKKILRNQRKFMKRTKNFLNMSIRQKRSRTINNLEKLSKTKNENKNENLKNVSLYFLNQKLDEIIEMIKFYKTHRNNIGNINDQNFENVIKFILEIFHSLGSTIDNNVYFEDNKLNNPISKGVFSKIEDLLNDTVNSITKVEINSIITSCVI